MHRFLTLIALVGAMVFCGVSAADASSPTQVPRHTDASDFTFDSFDARYELSRGEDGRSTLRTTERLVARFPASDQNRGIRRAIPREFAGHSTSPAVQSVTDETGRPRAYTTAIEDEFLVLTIALPEGQYAHGLHTYVITYTQRDVTRRYADTASDEFYWDTNGTGWEQPFARATATLVVAPDLIRALTGRSACYRGAEGSTTRCELKADGGIFSADETGLSAHENMTLAVGFDENTFAESPFNIFDLMPPLLLLGAGIAVADLILILVVVLRTRRGARTGRAIIAQYEPPEGVDAAMAAEIIGVQKRSTTATLLDLAVRREIRLLKEERPDRYGAEYTGGTVHLGKGHPLSAGEEMFLNKLFGQSTQKRPVGAKVWFTRDNAALGKASKVLLREAHTAVKRRKLRDAPPKWWSKIASFGFILALLLFALHCALERDWLLLFGIGIVGIPLLVWGLPFVARLLSRSSRLNHQGALLRDELMGLREYIRLAEADRIRMLQAPSSVRQGTLAVAVGDSGEPLSAEGVSTARVIEVNERLLPYAVIFGLEKQWEAELAKLYQEKAPEWYSSSDDSFRSINTLMDLHVAVSAFAATQHTPSAPFASWNSSSASSSSGGSSGGGFSGGGGGGGGGGGV